MSKKYKNKTCVYCVKPNSSKDGDHIVARGFFLPKNRMNLPKAPACEKCNNEKSELELYLTSVIPFGGTHAGADKTLRLLVKPRLEKNDKLRRKLAGKIDSMPAFQGQPTKEGSIPFNSKKILKLSEFIAKGLIYHHWQIYLPSDRFFVKAVFRLMTT